VIGSLDEGTPGYRLRVMGFFKKIMQLPPGSNPAPEQEWIFNRSVDFLGAGSHIQPHG
jgi:hypothetical protein